MVNGIVGLPDKPNIIREDKVTLYKKHPTIPYLVIVMPNLPNSLVDRDLFLNKKSYKKDPQELEPHAKVERTPNGEIYLVPASMKLESYEDKTEFPPDTGRTIPVINWRVVPIKGDTPEELTCPECGKACKSALGLSAHKRSHK